MTRQERLCAYMVAKVEALPGKPYEHLFNEEDKEELLSWNNEMADSAFLKLCNHLRTFVATGSIGDAQLCPWCMRAAVRSCYSCGFGIRHSLCSHVTSGYQRAVKLARKPFGEALSTHAEALLTCLNE